MVSHSRNRSYHALLPLSHIEGFIPANFWASGRRCKVRRRSAETQLDTDRLWCVIWRREEHLKISLNCNLDAREKVDPSFSDFLFKWTNYFADLRVRISKGTEDRLRPAAMANPKTPNYWPQEESAFLRLESLGVLLHKLTSNSIPQSRHH